MVDTNSHNGDAAASSAADEGAATQKLPTAETEKVAVTRVEAADGSVSGPSASGNLSGSTTGDSVASRRLAHGLAPEAAIDVATVKRLEKEANAEDRKRKAQRKHKVQVVRRTIIAIVLILIIGVLVGFWLLRWGLHDDTASIQGTWRVQGTDTTITINDEEIVLTDEVAYDYELDPEAKTLTFKFGALSGDGRYRFSLDHNMLAIDDGEFDAMGTLMTDIPWTIEAVAQKVVGNQEKSPSLENGNMVLERVS